MPELAAQNIDLFRPTRTSSQRPWAWRNVPTVDDTNDASDAECPADVSDTSLWRDVSSVAHDTPDTINALEQRLLAIHGDAN